MTKRTRTLAIGTVLAVAAATVARVEAADRQAETTDAPAVTRVRARTPALAAAIGDGIERSPTFRTLVETIDATDGIVYVERGECRHRRQACLVGVAVSGPNRIVQVRIDSRQLPWHVAWLIAHELQHAIEVLGDPRVIDNAALHLFYEREGRESGPNMFETDAAVRAGKDVRAEVRRYARVPAAR